MAFRLQVEPNLLHLSRLASWSLLVLLAAVTVSTQVPSIFSYIGLMLLISIPATVLAVASYRGAQHLKAMAVIFIGAAIVGGSTFYAFGLVTPKPPVPEEEQEEEEGGESPAAEEPADPPANTINATILPGSSAQGNPDYDPDPITISQGDGVQWANEDNTPHTVTSRQEGVFDSGLINPADAWLLDSAEIAPAEYEYYCTLHPFMVATLVVSNGAAPPSQSSENDTATQGAVINNQSGTSANNTGSRQQYSSSHFKLSSRKRLGNYCFNTSWSISSNQRPILRA